ncbi:hypothetical protein SRB5_33630 [Streptomyces sp. RB5]|uniref:Deoxyxylulose-5-phosphate synthase n=1 Tax=Streptomyces smaragdinus TaxID=2585196 RepID=A0A7K0CIB0_9ACTN|nr:hypothetical protein [Streptomyces smaragdinus]MQY13220.1 hypothetical protein [Streptomyces smaragdinus]
MGIANSHFVCLPCRLSVKRGHGAGGVCSRCGGELIDAGSGLAAPKRRDERGWRALAAVLNAGLDFRPECCCGYAGHRPRTPREVREGLALAGRTGMSPARALAVSDPAAHTDRRRRPGRGAWER